MNPILFILFILFILSGIPHFIPFCDSCAFLRLNSPFGQELSLPGFTQNSESGAESAGSPRESLCRR
jgi:hypothetical protein